MDQMLLATQHWLNITYSSVNGYSEIPEDGGEAANSRYLTYRALIKALQIELGGLTIDGDFGVGTVNKFDAVYPNGINEVSNTDTAESTNIGYIIQGALWTKGYNPTAFTGIFGSNTANAIKSFQSDAGITQNGKVTGYLLQGLMNTDDYGYGGTLTCDAGYKHQVQKKLNELYWTRIGLIAPNGLWERTSHKNLIKACQIEWSTSSNPLTIDGVFGTGTMNAAPTLSQNKTGWTNSKRLLQCALTVNGYWPGGLTGTFDSSTRDAVYNFQDFACLGADAIAGKNTWASLLKSCGNTARTATACDTATQLTLSQAQALKAAGYDTVGRYLTNAGEGDGYLNKKLTVAEIDNLSTAGLKVFPIYQTFGNNISYFTTLQGKLDAIKACEAAYTLGFPNYTVIYFAVDYDARTTELPIIEAYFNSIKMNMSRFTVGVYAPRSVCQGLTEQGITRRSFVCDMSSGFEGNIGVKLPSNWSYDQFAETTNSNIEIDKCIASTRATGILASKLTPRTSEHIAPTETYCGGENYTDATQHLWNKHNSMTYLCRRCPYSINSPTADDCRILSFEDQLKIKGLSIAAGALIGIRENGSQPYPILDESNPEYDLNAYYNPERFLAEIDNIRSNASNNTDKRYDYSNASGQYIREYLSKYSNIDYTASNNAVLVQCQTIDVVNYLGYSGLLDHLVETAKGIILSIYAPSWLNFVNDTLSTAVGVMQNDPIATVASIVSLLGGSDILSNSISTFGAISSASESNIEIGDRLIIAGTLAQMTDNSAEFMRSYILFDSNGNYKKFWWGYT